MERKTRGEWGEAMAATYLKRKKKYRLLDQNYRSRFGEIDIIARDGEYVVFVEVKLRKNADFGHAMEFVTYRKQQKIRATAQLWLMRNDQGLQPRFDVIEVYAPCGGGGEHVQINHIENAF